MKYFMTLGNVYYESETKTSPDDIEVPQHPGAGYDWDFNSSQWVYTAPVANSALPDMQIVKDRATGEPYEIFVENSILSSEKVGDS